MAEVDRMTARAPVEAGYMPLRIYLERFGNRHGQDRVDSLQTAAGTGEASEHILHAYVFTMMERR